MHLLITIVRLMLWGSILFIFLSFNEASQVINTIRSLATVGIFVCIICEIVLKPMILFQHICQLLSKITQLKTSKSTPLDAHNVQTNAYILPFKGNWFVYNGGISKCNSHSWGLISQRYAYDFIKIDNNGKSYIGSRKNVANYYCYNQDILAPADGVVVKVKNSLKDSRIFRFGITDKAVKDIRGNYILIRHSFNEYSVLAHLKKGSITVKKGDAVKCGDLIAKCGNSGNSTEPHLHFQVQKGKSFYFSEGIKINFINYTLINSDNNIISHKASKVIRHNVSKEGYVTKGDIVVTAESE